VVVKFTALVLSGLQVGLRHQGSTRMPRHAATVAMLLLLLLLLMRSRSAGGCSLTIP
jgi:hypothetical protein